jgi:hypothetical protein
MLDPLSGIGQCMSRVHPPHEVHVDWVVCHNHDRERRRWGSIQDRRSVQSHKVGNDKRVFVHGQKGAPQATLCPEPCRATLDTREREL